MHIVPVVDEWQLWKIAIGQQRATCVSEHMRLVYRLAISVCTTSIPTAGADVKLWHGPVSVTPPHLRLERSAIENDGF
eukprot:CAMPEP_0181411104 /NCGR_PEP_ID=MMETSP1110-20121109/7693_1 /TAXON_ID=174948 /ORGANISM="Symbiodinium sp., Strain CCMP421" /LENGTH=77 /DNA_ID=CAMNT_0023533693 /DNA_START=871 /DNA_END=1104 /DNA_ORIENTATION=-